MRLREIEMEDTMSDYDVVLKEAPALLIGSRKITVPQNDQVPRLLGEAYGEVARAIGGGGRRRARA